MQNQDKNYSETHNYHLFINSNDIDWQKTLQIVPIFHVYNVQHILQQTTLEFIVRLTTCSQRWWCIHFNQPATKIKFSLHHLLNLAYV